MKSLFVFGLILIQCSAIHAQDNLYIYVRPGRFQPGYMDTVLLDEKYPYAAKGYSGHKPYFIQIWHPVSKKLKKPLLKVKDLFIYRSTPALKPVSDSLSGIYKSFFISDYLTESLMNGDSIQYGKFTYEEVFELTGNQETSSIPVNAIQPSGFPVIVYHNGSQGHPFENFAMAEYFASRGFIFVTASFELQYGNQSFGMLPYERYITDEEEKSLQTVTAFARQLSQSPFLFFVGHSFGAQMGLRTFGQDSTIKGMVSLETTIEFKKDPEKIKEMWPEVYQKVITEETVYPFPVLFFAATGEKKPFSFLDNVKAPVRWFASTNKDVEHNAYLSLFYLRYFLDPAIPQPDKAILKARLPLYIKQLDLMAVFFDQVMKNSISPGTATFYIE